MYSSSRSAIADLSMAMPRSRRRRRWRGKQTGVEETRSHGGPTEWRAQRCGAGTKDWRKQGWRRGHAPARRCGGRSGAGAERRIGGDGGRRGRDLGDDVESSGMAIFFPAHARPLSCVEDVLQWWVRKATRPGGRGQRSAEALRGGRHAIGRAYVNSNVNGAGLLRRREFYGVVYNPLIGSHRSGGAARTDSPDICK